MLPTGRRRLTTEEVVARWDVGDNDSVLTVCYDQSVHCPACSIGVVEDLDPDGAAAVGCRWGDVHGNRTLEYRSEWIYFVCL